MKKEGKIWFEGLMRFIVNSRVGRPIVNREKLTVEQEVQCRIIGGSLIAWLRKYGPRLIEERAMLAGLKDWEEDPFIVFTSELPGLVAAREILEDSPATIAFLYPDEFEKWLKNHPDLEYRWHVHTWSLFTPVDADTAKNAQMYPLGPGESYWLHEEGTMCGQLFGRGGDHLWKWNGKDHVLLEESVNQWVS